MTTKAISASTAQAEPTNSDRFYVAKHDLFFCAEVVKLAACATAMQRSLNMMNASGKEYPEELKKIRSLCTGENDWKEMPDESIHWALELAAQRIDENMETMESAFMEALRASRDDKLRNSSAAGA